MTKLKGSCDKCNRQFEAKDAIVLQRTIACHKAKSHGIPGKSRRYLPATSPNTTGDRARDEALVRYYKQTGKEPRTRRALQAFSALGEMSDSSGNNRQEPKLIRIKLDHCPCCSTNFYATQP